MHCQEFEYSNHCLLRIIEREISVDDIEIVLKTGEVIKEYLNDKPYPSFLILGFVKNRALHVVAALFNETCIVITAYYADNGKWMKDFKTKR
jgi:hypothetical protein